LSNAETPLVVSRCASAPENSTKCVIGHERERLKLCKCINKLHYSGDVMRLIRGDAKRGKPAQPKRGRRQQTKPK
jgi:hypothetical protein